MAGQGPGLGQPADIRLVLTSGTSLAIQLYSMPKCEIMDLTYFTDGDVGQEVILRPGWDLDHLASKTKSRFL